MKRCSSWNWDSLDYSYWECPGNQSAGGWEPPSTKKKVATVGIGIDIEDALPKLPAGCRMVGRGSNAIGQIVKQGNSGLGSMLSPGFSVDWMEIAKYGTIGLLGFAVAAWVASGLRRK